MSPKPDVIRADDTPGTIGVRGKDLGSDNRYGVSLADSDFKSDSAGQKVRCGGCGREFWPDNSRKRYCDHGCYVTFLRRNRGSIEQRFWAKVNKNHPSGCWLWTASTSNGYGQIVLPRDANGVQPHVYAHRLSWEWVNGPIPDGLQANHHCDQPLCVRPDHLFLGTQTENIADATSKGRMGAWRKTGVRLNGTPAKLPVAAPVPAGERAPHLQLEPVPFRQLPILGEVA